MLSRLLGRSRQASIAAAFYDKIVTSARAPGLYAHLGVPDSVSGRFEMVVLHLFLVLHRLRDGGAPENAVGQVVFDTFCSEMDRSLRELGVGDLGVPKRMRQVGEAFYGRTQAYAEAIERNDETGLAAALARNVLKKPDDPGVGRPLARYALASALRLAAVPPAALVSGPLPYPDPVAFAVSPAGAAA
jgi:cytochrome b pre-mRNA-processing protein 3